MVFMTIPTIEPSARWIPIAPKVVFETQGQPAVRTMKDRVAMTEETPVRLIGHLNCCFANVVVKFRLDHTVAERNRCEVPRDMRNFG